ncbi:MAG: tetratricopeptide repeat protein [Paludibacter sp.]|nr:tetratricopeptide repeat protein [Paludibacter sp.]
MKKYSLLLVLISIAVFFQAQEVATIITKLKNELKSNSEETKRASIYSDLTWYYSTVSTDSALNYGQMAIQASTKLGDSTLIAQVYSDIAAVYFRKGDFSNSRINYLKAYKIRKIRKDLKGLAKINNNLANIYEKNQQYKLAMASFLDALSFFESVNDEKTSHIIKGNIGLILLKIKNYQKAFTYIKDVVEYQEENNSTDELCVSCLNLGNVYLQMNDTANALKMYTKSIKACTSVGNKKGISSGYNNIASIKSEQKESKDAIVLFGKSKKIREELNSDLDKANFDLNLANEFMESNRYNQAKDLLLAVEKVFSKTKRNEKLQKNYKSLIETYAYLNKPDSVRYYTNKLLLLNGELLESLVLKQTAELETKYQSFKKEKQLFEKEIEVKQKNQMLIRISFLAFFIALIGFLIYRQQRFKRKQESHEFELKTAIAEIETQNKLQDQRLSISRDLHDNIGSQLTFIISSVENIKYAFKLKNSLLESKLENISSFAKSTIVELRDTIWAMNTNEISFEDLKLRILNFIDKAKDARSDIQFSFNVNDESKNMIFNSIKGMNIYRTIQEAINNSLKYSNAIQISIDVIQKNSSTQIIIKDNGIGFDESAIEKGNGLSNMKKRMSDSCCSFELNSLNSGTTIILTITD